MTTEEWNKLLQTNESYKAHGELKKVENEYRKTKIVLWLWKKHHTMNLKDKIV